MSTEGFRKKVCSHLCYERNRLVPPAAQFEKTIGAQVSYLSPLFRNTQALVFLNSTLTMPLCSHRTLSKMTPSCSNMPWEEQNVSLESYMGRHGGARDGGLSRVKGQPDLHREIQSNRATEENLYQVIVDVRNSMHKDAATAKCKIMHTQERVQSLLPEGMSYLEIIYKKCIKFEKIIDIIRWV